MLLKFSDWFVYGLLNLSPESDFGGMVHFFVYDSVKILILLYAVIFAVGVLRSYLPDEKIKAWMSRKGLLSNVLAAFFGSLTPFCSCSSIPIFFGFIRAGIPVGATFSFLITSPLVNEYLVVLMLGFFGVKITVFYVLSGLAMGIFAGFFLGKMKFGRFIEKDMSGGDGKSGLELRGFRPRLAFGHGEAVSIFKKIWLWILAGIAAGALIHNYVPQETIQAVLRKTGGFSVPLAVILGTPLYGSCAAIIPVAVVLFHKGLPLGTALAFMMAMSALSLPEAVMLRRAMKTELILLFFSITAAGIVIIGYLFNFLQNILI